MRKIEKMLEKAAIVSATLLMPMMVLAASDLTGTINQLKVILNGVIGLLFVLVTLYFVWGVVQYVSAGGEDAKLKLGKEHMIWGIVGMAVMAGAWGLVNILLNTFGVGNANIPSGPQGY
ncbi:MAG: hypothetical protein PHT44_00950 [Candidatus Portnoybacteria bacterium]|nr:hypothetical protein [Candidatus Portnoybacteria bacterium]MDD4982821.1 hypothetical protein [Candidatus Portnoybacteria bacterium]